MLHRFDAGTARLLLLFSKWRELLEPGPDIAEAAWTFVRVIESGHVICGYVAPASTTRISDAVGRKLLISVCCTVY